MPTQHFSPENPFLVNKSAVSNPTGLKPAYTAAVPRREAEVDNSQSVQGMWFECDAEETRESGRRSFEERKRNSKGPGRFGVVCLHIDRERRLGAKSAQEPQRRKDRSGGNPARRRVSADLYPSCFLLSKQRRLVSQTHGPLRFGSNAFESSPVEKTNHAGRASGTNPKTTSSCASFLRASLSRLLRAEPKRTRNA
jgi:hypothetical protein